MNASELSSAELAREAKLAILEIEVRRQRHVINDEEAEELLGSIERAAHEYVGENDDPD